MEDGEKMIVMALAALFKAAKIAAGQADKGEFENIKAIKEAQEFVGACKAHGVWPEKIED